MEIIIKLQKRHLEEFKWCELGAMEDDMRGPSPHTTWEILERHERNIELSTPEEAAQVADAARYGTLRLHTSDAIADRIVSECLRIDGARPIHTSWDKKCWAALADRISVLRSAN